MTDHYLLVKNIYLHYIVEGSGPPLLFIHGHRSDALRWKPIIDKLAKHYTVYAPDLPGFGKSGELSSWHNLENYPPFILGLVEHLKLKKFVLASGSMGSVVAFLVTLKIPEKITRLILAGPVLDGSHFKFSRFKYLLYLAVVAVFAKSAIIQKTADWIIRKDRIFKNFLRIVFPREDRNKEIINYEAKQWRVMNFRVWAQTLYSLLRFHFPKTNKKYHLPVTLFFSENDRYLNREKIIISVKKIFPNTEIVILPGLEHVPRGEIPPEMLEKFDYLFKEISGER